MDKIFVYMDNCIRDGMSNETLLMEFEVKKEILLGALDVSNIGREIAIGVIGDSGDIDNGIYHGIFFNRGMDVPSSEYRTMYYLNYPIVDNQMRHFKVHVKKWLLVFF